MFIKQITIEGVQGDVEIARTDDGALVTSGDRVLCELRREDGPDVRFAKAREAAKAVYGESRDRRSGQMVLNATNSMIHDVLNEIERVAGC